MQALCVAVKYGTPRRTAIGFDTTRLALLLAVLERHGRLPLGTHDVFLNLAGDSDPVEEAMLRVDFPACLDTLPRVKRRACVLFLDGERTKKVARRRHVSPSRVSQMRRELVEGWDLFTL